MKTGSSSPETGAASARIFAECLKAVIAASGGGSPPKREEPPGVAGAIPRWFTRKCTPGAGLLLDSFVCTGVYRFPFALV